MLLSFVELKWLSMSQLHVYQCVQLTNNPFKRQALPMTHRIMLGLAAEDCVDTEGKELLGIVQQVHWIAVIHDQNASFCSKPAEVGRRYFPICGISEQWEHLKHF